ncbi:ferredoxin [Tilletiaria anomala UBC 951]|uniref:Ferredoxin n=1 Tax=Tilletiaria anomala (strain ATCC 24038 / CBS 436.72 / UBC 951) TaxID=1037660 RepID=A0A066VCI8_TILAU|nr:ferredoxin [Tilletiaria anomala UBC 951]KDN36290.1 ferredoxin [Tilletiaria anomala UBC 951]
MLSRSNAALLRATWQTSSRTESLRSVATSSAALLHAGNGSSLIACKCQSGAATGKSAPSRLVASVDSLLGDVALRSVARRQLPSKMVSSKRYFHCSSRAQHGSLKRPEPGTGIKVTFRDSKGSDIKTVEVNEGDDLLSIAHEYDIDLEGACEGSIACSTCHVILEPDVYDKLEEPGDDENDMLDLAFGLTDTSRLGCQVKVTKELDGMVAQLPAATRNMYVDGAKAGHGS